MAVLYLVAYGLLVWLYASYVVQYWSYVGFEWDFVGDRALASAIIILLFVFLIPNESSVRSFYLNLLLTIYLLPSLVIYSAGKGALGSSVIIWSAIGTVYFVSALPLPRLHIMSIRSDVLMWTLSLLTALFISSFVVLGGYRNFNINIAAVYDFRRDAAEALPGIFGYLTPMFSNIVIPFGVATALIHRRYMMVVVFCFAAFLMFGFTSHKGIIFTPVFAVGAYYFLLRYGRYSAVLVIFIGALLIGVVDTMMMSGPDDNLFGWYTSLFIRRALLQPAMIEFHYLELFSEVSQYYWSNSRVTLGLVPDPHGIVAPRLVGEVYFGSSESNANTGFVGSGYAQAGLLGVFLYSVGVGLIFAFFQSYGRYMSMPFVVAAASGLALVIFAADFLTLFLTHGMLVLMLLFTIVRSPQAEAMEKAESDMDSAGTLQHG